MYHRLADAYLLRGWQHMTNVLLHQPTNQIIPCTGKEFHLLLLCDGCTDFTDRLSAEEKQTLEALTAKGYVTACETPTPIRKEQQYVLYRNRYVRSACWSITGRCNYHCRHCYMDAPDAQLGEVTHEEAMDFIDQMHRCGIRQVDLTGGEPFVRKDFWQLVDHMTQYGMVIGMVYTNGWLLTEQVLDAFAQRGQHPEFSISFDGVGWHDWMRRVPGAEEAALRAFDLCKRRGYAVNVEMCLHRGNMSTLRDTVKLLAAHGVHALKVGKVQDSQLWHANSEGNAMTTEAYCEAAIDYIPYYYEDGMPMDVLLGGVVMLKRHGEYTVIPERHANDASCLEHHLCGAVRASCYITPEGRLLPCLPMTSWEGQSVFPRIQEEGLQKLLSTGLYMDMAAARVKDLLQVNPQCNACEHKYQCGGGCRASAVCATGDMMGCDPEQCLFYRMNYAPRIRAAADAAMAKYGVKAERDVP